MKYIMLETKEGMKLPILFPDILTHCFVAGAMQLAVDCLDSKKDLRPKQLMTLLESGSTRVTGAGFVAVDSDVRTFGESESLGGVTPGVADAARIALGDAVALATDAFVLKMAAELKCFVDDP